MSYIFEDFPEEFLTFEDIVGEDVPCHDDYLDERFTPIPGHPDYFISTFGRVYSLKSHQFLTLKKMDKQGHVGFSLSEPGRKPDYVYLHRLMADAFIYNPDELPVVRHLNDDPIDNDLDNLAWGTQRDNWYDSVRNGTAHPPTDEDREIGFQKMRIPVLAVNLETGEETEFPSQTDAGRELGIEQANIWKVLNGERRSAGGYYFEYSRRGEEE